MEGEEAKVDPPAEQPPEMEAPADGDPAMEGMDPEMEAAAEEGASPDAVPAEAMEGEMEEEEPQEDFSQDASKYFESLIVWARLWPPRHTFLSYIWRCNYVGIVLARYFHFFATSIFQILIDILTNKIWI